jgi:hypothetical protein
MKKAKKLEKTYDKGMELCFENQVLYSELVNDIKRCDEKTKKMLQKNGLNETFLIAHKIWD